MSSPAQNTPLGTSPQKASALTSPKKPAAAVPSSPKKAAATPSGSKSPKKEQPKKEKPAAGGKKDAGAGTPGDANGKGMSAKELKKANRAAKVAARAAVEAPGAPGAGAAAGAAGAGAGSAAGGAAAAAGAPGAPGASGPSKHRRAIAAEQAAAADKAETRAQTHPAATFFSHLPAPRDPNTPAALESGKLHPTIVRLGVLIHSGTLRGASARTVAVLEAFREVVRDYECPDTGVFWKDLNQHISPMIAFLETCRPKGVGVGNAIRWFKGEINRLGEAAEEALDALGPTAGTGYYDEAAQKAALIEAIGVYLRDRIDVAGQVIADNCKEKIRDGDTVVVYARSSVIERVLIEAWKDMRDRPTPQSFKVVVVDSRPLHEGKAMLNTLSTVGIPCTYTLLPLASTSLSRASLVLLGGASLNSDGALQSRAGTAVLAMLAKEHRVPVVACVETFKLSERVSLDDLSSNEIGAAGAVLSIPAAPALEIATPIPAMLTPLSFLYDLTPPDCITAVCTEVGFIPPSSVPTLLGKTVHA